MEIVDLDTLAHELDMPKEEIVNILFDMLEAGVDVSRCIEKTEIVEKFV